MLLVHAFLLILSGLLSYFVSPFLLLIGAIPAVYLVARKRKHLYLLLLVPLGALIAFLSSLSQEGEISSIFLVVEKKSSYCIVASIKGRYILYDKNLTLFSLVRIEGIGEKLDISHFEMQFDFSRYLLGKGVQLKLVPSRKEVIFDSFFDLTPLKTWALSYTKSPGTELADSLIFGTSLYGIEKADMLQDMGLTSAFSLGGFHISFLINMILFFLGRKRRRMRTALSVSLSFFFMLISSFRYSLRRIFLLHLVNALDKNRKLDSLSSLCLVYLILTLLEPWSVISASFYYSFPFLLLLRLFPLSRRNGKNRFLFFTMLFVFYLPYRLSEAFSFNIASPLLQLVLVPLSHLVFLISVLCILIPPAGVLLSPIASLIINSSDIIASNSLEIITGKIDIIIIVIFYILLIIGLLFRERYLIKFSNIAFTLSFIAVSSSFVPDFLPHYEVHFIDVNQGDCTLIRDGRTNVMIDTGGINGVDLANDCLVPFLKSMKITHLDAVIITHYDFDHYGALADLSSLFRINQIYDAFDILSLEGQTAVIDSLKINNLNKFTKVNDSNAQSGVYMFSIKNTSFLIMGDAPKSIEEQIVDSGCNIDVDILRIGHHGSSTSTTNKLLESTTPREAVISVGENNSYGHPSQNVLSLLKSNGIVIRRTDIEGTISYYL